MHIVLVTDAWFPQMNGVVRTWSAVQDILQRWGHEVTVINWGSGPTGVARGEPGGRLRVRPMRHLLQALQGRTPDALHIVTQGSLGLAARRLSSQRGWAYTTSLQTRLPEHLRARLGIAQKLTWRYLKWFHAGAKQVLAPSQSIIDRATQHGLTNLTVCTPSVDAQRFTPGLRCALDYFPRPIFMAVGRLAPEKNLDAFLGLELPGTKVVLGTGSQALRLQQAYPDVLFVGHQDDAILSAFYRAADVLVFPGRTDAVGLVMLEAMACGTPVAAFACDAPRAAIREGVSGCMDDDLWQASIGALAMDRAQVREHAQRLGWERCARIVLNALVPCARVSPLPNSAATYYNTHHT